MGDERVINERVAKERVINERVAKERVINERVAKERVINERVANEYFTNERVANERVDDEQRFRVTEQKSFRKRYTKKLVCKETIDKHKQCCMHEKRLLNKVDLPPNAITTVVEDEICESQFSVEDVSITQNVHRSCAAAADRRAYQNVQVI